MKKSSARPKYRDLEAIKIGYNALVDGGSAIEIPVIFSTDSTAIIGRKGSGKTTLARVLAEGLIERHLHPVIIDPLDVWWGLRAAADGVASGLDVVIFGGSHADLPITEQSAAYIADLIVDKGISAVLVLDEMKQAGQRRFVQKFLEQLFERKRPQEQRTPLHVIIDEADTFVPQNPMTPEAIGSLSEVDRAVRHGRSRGIGTTVISQRPAKVNKDVLTQCEVLFALQVTGAQDRKALKEWTDAKATEEQAKAFWKSLASMKRGQAWVWSPSLLDCFQMVDVDLPWTYDSSFTPSLDGKKRATAKLKDLDISSIKDALAAHIEEVKANDPKTLKAEVARLTKIIANTKITADIPKAASASPVHMTKQMAKMTEGILTKAIDAEILKRDAVWKETMSRLFEEYVKTASTALTRWSNTVTNSMPKPHKVTFPIGIELRDGWNSANKIGPRDVHVQRVIDHNTILGPGQQPDHLTRANAKRIVANLTEGINAKAASSGDITGPERKVLTVLAQHAASDHEDGLPKSTVAARAGYALSGSFSNILTDLRNKGLMSGSGGEPLKVTEEGITQLGHYEPMPTGPELLTWWKEKCSGPEVKVLDALATNGAMSKEELAAATGYAMSGSFSNILTDLRNKGIISGKGREAIKLHEDLT